MKIALFFLFFAALFFVEHSLPAQVTEEDDKIYTYVGEWPEYTGGTVARTEFLVTNLKYPEAAERARIEGKVIVAFTIEKDGKVSNVKVIKGVDPLLDSEAERVVAMMPNWKPGKNLGVPVRVRFKIDIIYKLPEKRPFSIAVYNVVCDSTVISSNDYPFFRNKSERSFKKFMLSELVYPEEAMNKNIGGTVNVVFTVGKDNQIKDIRSVKKVNKLFEKEVTRVLLKANEWKAGKVNGVPIDVKYTMEVDFNP